jgi:hypothetical protein
MEQSEYQVYRVNEREGEFEVLNDSGNVIVVCRDESSATNYAVLLRDAFERGYRTGFRDGKGARIPNQKS